MARNINGGTDRIAWALANQGGTPSTFICRFRTTQLTANVLIAQRWSGTSRNGWAILMNGTANKLTILNYNAASPAGTAVGTTTVNDGAWHSLVFNQHGGNGGSNQLFIDGSLDSSFTNASNVGVNGSFLTIGDSYDAFWPSTIADYADLGYWNNVPAFTADEIAAYAKGLSAAQFRVSEQELIAPLVRDHQDRLGNAIAGSGFSGTTVVDHPRVMGSLV